MRTCAFPILAFALACTAHSAQPDAIKPMSEKDFALIAPVDEGELRLRPTFESCGVCWGRAREIVGLEMEFRREGAFEWCRAPWPPPYFAATRDYRASLIGLAEDTRYAMRLVADGKVYASGTFRTWAAKVPVARTVKIDAGRATFPILIHEKGRSDGWIRYVVTGGALSNGTREATMIVTNASYVLIEGALFKGAPGGFGREPLRIVASRGVRVRNCEFTGWGRAASPDWEDGGRFADRFGKRHNWHAAITIGHGASEVAVERCYAHDPLGRANSWRYSHPAGPEAVLMDAPDHSCVIRHCDFVGSDLHRWNDAIEGALNGSMTGGFNRDGDVSGNFLVFANDDGVEMDGGQQNVRCFGNRFEGALSGVSVQCSNAGPGYVFDNLFCEMGEEFGCANPAIKTAGIDLRAYGPPSYLCGNTFFGKGGGIETYAKLVRYTVESNVFAGARQRLILPNGNRVAGNRLNVEIGAEALDANYPRRPLPFTLTRTLIGGVVVREGAAAPATVTFAAVHDGKGAATPFTVRKNDVFDWFEVSPSHGVIPVGGRVTFSLRFRPERMSGRRFFRGAFLVRTPDGLSRPCTVYAEASGYVQPRKPSGTSGAVAYAEVSPTVLDAAVSTNGVSFSVDVPKEGRYHFMVYGKSDVGWPGDGGWSKRNATAWVSVDGGERQSVGLQAEPFDTWMVVTPGCGGFGRTMKRFPLTAGRHTLTLAPRTGTFHLGEVAAVEDPGPFEPR